MDHRIFEYRVRAADEFRHVDEIVEPSWAVPVVFLIFGRLDIDDPVDELAAFRIDRVADRIEQQLRWTMPADAYHAGAGENRLPPRHAAPHVDAGIFRGTFVGIEPLAQHRMNALAAHHDAAALRLER